jgi:hypothetical protein
MMKPFIVFRNGVGGFGVMEAAEYDGTVLIICFIDPFEA